MSRNRIHFFYSMLLLQRIALRMYCWISIFNFQIGFWELRHSFPHCGSYIPSQSFPIPNMCAFHLVKNGVVTSVDSITAIDIGANEKAVTLIRPENICLVC